MELHYALGVVLQELLGLSIGFPPLGRLWEVLQELVPSGAGAVLQALLGQGKALQA